jgi:hypothetical protein
MTTREWRCVFLYVWRCVCPLFFFFSFVSFHVNLIRVSFVFLCFKKLLHTLCYSQHDADRHVV